MAARKSLPSQAATPRLPRRVRAALADFQRRLLQLFPNDINQIILFGSYARGEAGPDSDVDVMVVVKWEEVRLPDGRWVSWIGDSRWRAIVHAAADTLLESGLDVAPVIVGEERFRSGFPLANRAKREGLVLWPSRN